MPRLPPAAVKWGTALREALIGRYLEKRPTCIRQNTTVHPSTTSRTCRDRGRVIARTAYSQLGSSYSVDLATTRIDDQASSLTTIAPRRHPSPSSEVGVAVVVSDQIGGIFRSAAIEIRPRYPATLRSADTTRITIFHRRFRQPADRTNRPNRRTVDVIEQLRPGQDQLVPHTIGDESGQTGLSQSLWHQRPPRHRAATAGPCRGVAGGTIASITGSGISAAMLNAAAADSAFSAPRLVRGTPEPEPSKLAVELESPRSLETMIGPMNGGMCVAAHGAPWLEQHRRVDRRPSRSRMRASPPRAVPTRRARP